MIVVICALAAAFINAVAVVWMRRAAGVRRPKELFSRDMFFAIARQRLWLAAVGLQLAGFMLQAVALKFGSIILVEPLMTMILVFLVLILHYRYGIKVGHKEWLAVGLVCVGLLAMLSAARPRGEQLDYRLIDWIIIVSVIAGCIAGCIWVVRRSRSPRIRAAFGGLAVAANIGLTAGLTKLVIELAGHGFGSLATSWELYALIASGLISAAISQSAFAAGPLVISQPIIEILNPIVSGIIAVTAFDSDISTSVAALGIMIPGFIMTVVGLVLIGGSKRFQRSHLSVPKPTVRWRYASNHS